MIMTWDEGLQRYRVWRFSTVAQQPDDETLLRVVTGGAELRSAG